MKILAVDHRVVRWPTAPGGAARGRIEREAVIVGVRDESGATGLGEAAPLPPMSIDSISDALLAVETLARRVPVVIDSPRHAVAVADRITAAPAARFALETALLAVLAQRRGTSIAALLSTVPQAELELAVVVDDASEATAAAARGARCLKIKVGPTGDIDRVHRISRAAPQCQLRLDANRMWSASEVPALLAALRGLPIDFVEEPCVNAHELLAEPLAMKLALDESLIDIDPATLARVLRSPRLAALVLKPTLLGGFKRCMELATAAHRHGVAAVVTHTLESPVGFAACRELARAIGGDVPVGLAPLPAPPKPRAPAKRSCSVLFAVHTEATADVIREAWERGTTLALLHAKATTAEKSRQRAMLEAATLHDDDAFVLFTSGSTGPARGVVHTRESVLASAAASAANLGWRDDDRWLCCLPMAHAGGLSVILRCLLAGKRAIIDEDVLAIRDATLASLVPTQLAALLEDPAWRPPTQLRAVLLGGAAAPHALVEAAVARGVPVLPTYGLTETFGQIATAREPGGLPRLLDGVSIGGGTAEAPTLLRVRGPMLASRYLDGVLIAPELVTADLGWVDRGIVYVAGRADDVIISGGENVHPTQIEAVLSATPGVRDAVAFGVQDARWGQVVAVALAADELFDRTTALARWHSALPPHARPRRMIVVPALPRLPSGKLDRRSAATLPASPIEYG